MSGNRMFLRGRLLDRHTLWWCYRAVRNFRPQLALYFGLIMRRARRLTALLASLGFAHALWAGSGFACAVPNAAQEASASVNGMTMSGMDMGAMTASGGAEHHHAPCEIPSASDGCQSMAPCAPLALATAAEVLAPSADLPTAIAPLVALAPPSLVTAPESPPPRA